MTGRMLVRFRGDPIRLLRTTVCALVLSLSGSAQASYINFSFFGGGISGSGSINVTANGHGTDTATSGTLLVLGDPSVSTASLVGNPNRTSVAFASAVPTAQGNYDDQVLPLTTGVDADGLYFRHGPNAIFLRYLTTTGPFGITTTQYHYTDYNTATTTPLGFNLLGRSFSPVMDGAAPVPSSVPTPRNWALLGLGCGGLIPFALRWTRSRLMLAA